MSSIETCLRKAGKAIDADDAAAIRDIYNDYTKGGMPGPEAAQKALSDYLEILDQEIADVAAKVEAAGGSASLAAARVLYAAGSKEEGIAKKLAVTDILYENASLPGVKGKMTTRKLARLLTARVKKLNRGKPLSAKTERNKEIIAETLALETLAAMRQTGHAGHWYSDTLKEAVSLATTLHPELETDAHARTAFLVAMAITSNGSAVDENTKNAELVYAEYKRKKKFPIVGFGAESGAMKKAFKLFNQLNDAWGMDVLTQFLHTQFTVRELKTLGMSVSGELADTVVYGSAIFGPKVGQGFYQNLAGNFDPLTMDRWFMRTWGRMAGNLAPEGISAAGDRIEKVYSLLDANKALVEELGFTVEQIQQSDKALLDFASKVHRIYARGDFKDKSDINRAAKNLDIAVNDPVVSPRNGAERNWIREVVAEAKAKLRQRGVEVDTASMQALLWYPEKEFYLKLGAGNERSKPTDYAQEFEKLAVARGISKSRIEAARAAGRAGRAPESVGSARTDTKQKGRGRALAEKERSRLIQRAAVRTVREAGRPAFTGRPPKGGQRKLGDVPVAQVYKMGVMQTNKYTIAGWGAPEFSELARTEDAAQLFHNLIKQPEYTADEFENMRLFLTPDGKAGFALDGDNLVSVFKRGNILPGFVQSAARLAVEQGARRVTVADGHLPHIYGMQGFRAVSRTSGPKKGGPDEVYMVYDQNHYDGYAGEGVMQSDAAGAVSLQDAAVDGFDLTNGPDRPLRYRLEDADDNVDQHPETPLSQLHKIAATMEDQLHYGPADARSIKRRIGDSLLGKNASNLEHFLGAIPRRHLQDFVDKNDMPSMEKYIRIANRMDGRRNELLIENEKVGKRWTKYTAKNKNGARILGELMHASTLAGVDGSAPYKSLKARKVMSVQDRIVDAKRRSDHKLLSGWWNRLDEEAQGIYKEVRDTYAKQRKMVETALEVRIMESKAAMPVKKSLILELREKFEAGRVAGPYFPLARFGELWAVAKDKEGTVVAFSKFEKVKEQREWMAGFRSEGFAVDGGKKLEESQLMQRLDPEFVAKITEMAGELDVGLADEIWQMYLRAMPEMSMRKAFIHRKGRLGFSADAIRSFGHNMFHGAHQLAKLQYMHAMEAQLDTLKEEARTMETEGKKDALWGAALYKEMVRRHEWARNPTASAIATKATSLGFAWYLGATPAAAMVNLSQTPIVAFPTLAARFTWGGAATELSKAAALWGGSRGNVENKLRGDDRAAMEEARRIGLFEKTQAHDLAGVSEDGIDYTSNGRRAMEAISYFFHTAEQANREVTFLAGYRLGRAEGLSHEDAIITAEDLTWDSHFDYNNVNRPRYMQSNWMRVLLLFRQYSLNMTYRLARDFNDSLRGLSPEKRSQSRQRLGGILMMTGIFAGATGLPLAWLVEGVLNAMFSDPDEPFDAEDALRAHLTEQYGSKTAEVIMKGGWDAMVGATMSSRVSLSDLWIREAPAHLEGDELWMHYIGEAAGPVPAIPKDYFQAYSLAKEGYYGRALEKMTPKFMTDGLKAYRYLSDGVQNMRGDVIIPKDELTNKDAFFQAIGFTPASLTMQYEENRAVKNAERKILDRRSRLMDKLFLAQRNEDKQGVLDVLADIRRFNKKNPSVEIEPSSIISSAKSRANYSAMSMGGVTLNKNLRHLHHKYRFTPRGEE